MAPLTWRVALTDLRKGFKVKSSSPVFSKGKHEFCLDVYRDGWGDEDRDFVSAEFDVKSFPTITAFKGGKMTKYDSEERSVDALTAFVESV